MSIPCHCRAIKCQCYSKSLFLCHDCREEEVSVGKVQSTPKCIRANPEGPRRGILLYSLCSKMFIFI